MFINDVKNLEPVFEEVFINGVKYLIAVFEESVNSFMADSNELYSLDTKEVQNEKASLNT